jgi:Pyruvate/2-oxoacid:ferredoxin oxidoreductase gamma subunit
VVRLDSVAKAIREEFPGKIGDANIAAAPEAHDAVAARVMTAA